jgi:hypothetical protein
MGAVRLAGWSTIAEMFAGGGGALALLALTGPMWIREISKALLRRDLYHFAKDRQKANPADPTSISILLRLADDVMAEPKKLGRSKLAQKVLSTVDEF